MKDPRIEAYIDRQAGYAQPVPAALAADLSARWPKRRNWKYQKC